MSSVAEIDEAPLTSHPGFGMQVGDVFEGALTPADVGDSLWVHGMEADQPYDLVLTGLDFSGTDSLELRISDTLHWTAGGIVAGENSISLVADPIGVVSGSWSEGDSFGFTYTPLYSQSYIIELLNHAGQVDPAYTISVAEHDPMVTSSHEDNVTGTEWADILDLLAGDDTVQAGHGSDDVAGGDGHDLMYGGSGQDTLSGGSGNDTVLGGSGHDVLSGGTGDDSMQGDSGNDSLEGGEGHDTLQGDNHDDTLDGGRGNDILRGGSGADHLSGGLGNDLMIGGSGADLFVMGVTNRNDTITDFEIGVDRIDLSLMGVNSFAQLIISDDGTDTTIDFGVSGRLVLRGVLADDLSETDFVINPGPQVGTTGDDFLVGGAFDDTIDGGEGKDKLVGRDGNDVLKGGNGKDVLSGGNGNDTLDGGEGNDRLQGGAGNDDLTGGDRNDALNGGAGDDTLFSGDGNDKLTGGAGADVLAGGQGRDVLTGGADADLFIFVTNGGEDRITDFEDGVDLLDYSAFGFTDISDLTLTQVGADAVITIAAEAKTVLTLLNTDITDLGNDDFIFA